LDEQEGLLATLVDLVKTLTKTQDVGIVGNGE
jgi:hypothetical protein